MNWRRGKSYQQDLRDRVLGGVGEGGSVRAVAQRFDVSPSYVSKVSARRRLTGETTARAQCSHQRPKLEPYYEAIRAEVAARPDATLAELCDWLRSSYGASSSLSGMWKALRRLGLTLKKRPSGRQSRIGQPSPRAAGSGAAGSRG
jgi:transposase